MGHYEDDLIYIYQMVEKEDLMDSFNELVEEINTQYKHKTVKEKWDLAFLLLKEKQFDKKK